MKLIKGVHSTDNLPMHKKAKPTYSQYSHKNEYIGKKTLFFNNMDPSQTFLEQN